MQNQLVDEFKARRFAFLAAREDNDARYVCDDIRAHALAFLEERRGRMTVAEFLASYQEALHNED